MPVFAYDDMGFMYLMMEFEVTGGTVNFATMAMADSSDFDNVFDLKQHMMKQQA